MDNRILTSTFVNIVLLVLLTCIAAAQAPVKLGVIDAFNFNPEISALALGISRGTQAAVARCNREGGVNGRPVVLINKTSDYSEESYARLTDEIVGEHPDLVAMINGMGNYHINLMTPALERHNLAHLSPIASDPVARFYSPHNVYIRPDPWAEIVAMLTSVVSRYRIKRIALMYTVGFNDCIGDCYGVVHTQTASRLMKQLELEFVYVFKYDFNIKSGDAPTNFSLVGELGNFLLTRPDAVLCFGGADISSVEFMVGALTHPMAATYAPKLKFFVTEALAIVAIGAFNFARMNPQNRVFITSTYPLATDLSYRIVREYHADMAAVYGAAYRALPFTAIAGYISTRFAVEVLRRTTPLTRENILKTVYSSGIFEVSDVTYGIFKGDCARTTETHCRCNEGAHFIDLATLGPDFQMYAVPNSTFTWPYSTCSGQEIAIEQPTNYLQLYTNGSTQHAGLAALLRRGKAIAESTSALRPRTGDIAQRALDGAADVAGQIRAINETLLVTAVAHSVFGERAGLELPWALLDPFEPEARLALNFSEKVLHTSATLQQELHAVASFASGLGLGLTLVAPGDRADAMYDALQRSAVTFNTSATLRTVAAGGSVGAALAGLSSSGAATVAFVCGLRNAADAAAVVDALQQQPLLRAAVAAAEYMAWYGELVAATAAGGAGGASASERLYVATNLPHWGAGGASGSALVRDYHSALGAAGATAAHPLELRAMVATRALVTVLDFLPLAVTPASVLKTWYDVSIVLVDSEVALGPYYRTRCGPGVDSETCECNVGARRVRIFSLATILRGTSAAADGVYTFGGCRVRYVEPSDGGAALGSGAIVGLVLGAAVIVAGAVAAGWLSSRGPQRDTRNAPKDASKPYTLVFTDIQGSTSLWARVPEEMGPALDQHHEIIRGLIKKHRGYEVKTVGDAFFIAFESADDAVNLCEELQWAFFQHDWGTAAIDETYRQLEQEALEDDPATLKTNSCKLPRELYEKMWNGLRVRCGIHTGLGDIKFDPVTLGYDYYGSTSNIAARVESVCNGGQVCMTAATAAALKTERALTSLGPIALRGCTEPVEMLQLDPIPGRSFPPLRLDAADEADELTGSDAATQRTEDTNPTASDLMSTRTENLDTSSSTATSMTQRHARNENCNLRDAMPALFSTMDADARRSTLRKLGTKWRVTVKHSKDVKGECDDLVTAIAKRVLGVLNAGRRRGPATTVHVLPLGSLLLENSQALDESHRANHHFSPDQPSLPDVPGMVVMSLSGRGATTPTASRKYEQR